MYEYKLKEIVKIYDGDTITAIVDLGFNTTRLEVLRLARIDTPEIRGEERPDGLLSRDYVVARIKEAIDNDLTISIKTFKDHKGKYGRYIADVYIEDECLNDTLVTEGLAEYRDY